MPKMCALRALGVVHENIYVNPANIRYVRPGAPGNTTIYFQDSQTISVAMTIEEVIRALDVAMNADQS